MGFRRQSDPLESARLGPIKVLGNQLGSLLRDDNDVAEAGEVRKRLVVTGSAGMLGQRVCDVARVAGWEVIEAPRAVIEISDLEATVAKIEELSPTAVINCAAWTNVDGAEESEAEALAANGTGAGNLAKATAAIGARLIHVSTDYVFAGDATEPYAEDAVPAERPESAYGRTKLAGEQRVAEFNPNHLICRTAWVFGSGGGNFVDTMVKLAASNDSVNVVSDQIGSPTWTGHLAPALVKLAGGKQTGVAHTAGSGQTSWHGLAAEVFKLIGGGTDAVAVGSEEFVRPAKRPAWSVLSSTREDVEPLPDWHEGVASHLRETNQI